MLSFIEGQGHLHKWIGICTFMIMNYDTNKYYAVVN